MQALCTLIFTGFYNKNFFFFFLQEIQQSMSIYLNKTCYNSFALLESITNFFPFDYRQTVFSTSAKCHAPLGTMAK